MPEQEKQLQEEQVQEEQVQENKPLTYEDLQKEFLGFLEEKGYDINGMFASNTEAQEIKPYKRRNFKKISEDLNRIVENEVIVYADTTRIVPGHIVYGIEKVSSKPYDKFKPVPRVVTGVHDNGVNNGQFFLTYKHEFVKNPDFKGYKPKSKTKEKEYIVVAREEEFFSPLTKDQATYMCDVLNSQSKQAYLKGMEKILKNAKKTKDALSKANKVKKKTLEKTKAK